MILLFLSMLTSLATALICFKNEDEKITRKSAESTESAESAENNIREKNIESIEEKSSYLILKSESIRKRALELLEQSQELNYDTK